MVKIIKEDALIGIGLSKNETKVYIALLDLGSATAGKIAEKSKVHRTNVYDALERLIEKGVVSYIFKKDIKNYHATDPENLLNLVKEKEINLMQILPELKLSRDMAKTKPTAHISEGVPALKLIFYDLLKYNKPIYIIGLPGNAPYIVRHWIDNFHKERAKRKIDFIHIYNHNVKERIDYLNKLPYTKARALPAKYDSPVSIMSCGEEVVVIMWEIKPLLTIRIHNPTFSKSFSRWFDLMWDLAK